jgi:hypothetical protein
MQSWLTRDYHDEMNSRICVKYVKDKMVPILSRSSIVFIISAPDYNAKVKKAPTASSENEILRKCLQACATAISLCMQEPPTSLQIDYCDTDVI